jgi:hypothetical protein
MAGHSALSPSRRRRRPGPDPKRIAHVAKACWSRRHDAQPRPSLRHVGKSCWWKAYPPGPAACPRRRPTRCLARLARCFATAECGFDHAGAPRPVAQHDLPTCATQTAEVGRHQAHRRLVAAAPPADQPCKAATAGVADRHQHDLPTCRAVAAEASRPSAPSRHRGASPVHQPCSSGAVRVAGRHQHNLRTWAAIRRPSARRRASGRR